MNERIKELRKTLNMTQQEFAGKLKTSRGNIAAYEVGKNIPSDAAVNNICNTFNVSEDWLRAGVGKMFLERSKDDLIEAFIGDLLKNEEDSFKRRLISGLAALDETGWEILENFLDSIQKKRD